MAAPTWKASVGERLYGLLLYLYPSRFRVQFGAEMRQVFRDCYGQKAEVDGLANVVTFWIHTLRDLAASLANLWPQEFARIAPLDFSISELADSLTVPVLIVVTLLAAGHTLATLVGSLAPPAKLAAAYEFRNTKLLNIAGVGAAVLGIAGALGALVIGRCHRAEHLSIRLFATGTPSKKEGA